MELFNILADRYASPEMIEIWSPENKIILERQLWLAVLEAQSNLGVAIPSQAIQAYQKVLNQVDLKSIRERELITRHDVKARIEEFSELAGYQYIHYGMTSRDLTENIEQLQVRNSMTVIRNRMVAILHRLSNQAEKYAGLAMVGRSHNVPAQMTTFGKRLATCAEETLNAFSQIEGWLKSFPLRGIQGPMGTAQDQLQILGTSEKVEALQQQVAKHLGFDNVLDSVGQVYPRSLDFDVVSLLIKTVAGLSSLATTFRLMSGQDLMNEGQQVGQIGSSAMPHKVNARNCERVNGLMVVLRGYLTMLSELAGSQWNEGDVFCSVVRRVALPDAFLACDGLLQTFLTILDEYVLDFQAIENEAIKQLPYLVTTKILVAAVEKGLGREIAHQIIQSEIKKIENRSGSGLMTLLIQGLIHSGIGLTEQELNNLLSDRKSFLGTSTEQVVAVVSRVRLSIELYSDLFNYKPSRIL